jgi:hypothetical protein
MGTAIAFMTIRGASLLQPAKSSKLAHFVFKCNKEDYLSTSLSFNSTHVYAYTHTHTATQVSATKSSITINQKFSGASLLQ